MKITGLNQDQTIQTIAAKFQKVEKILVRVKRNVPHTKRAIDLGQAAFLYAMVHQLAPKRILEIGTALGFSAAVMAEAAPDAEIITLNPNHDEAQKARQHLASYKKVRVIESISWEYLAHSGSTFDLIFVDGDHARVRLDLAWFDRLNEGGTIVFHDYSPAGTYRECPPVFEAVNEMKILLGQEPSWLLVDQGNVGMAAFTREQKKIDDNIEASIIHASVYSSCSQQYLEQFYHVAAQVQNSVGVAIECGVKHGGSAAVMALGSHRTGRQVKLFDSFKGYNPPLPIDGGRAAMKFERPGWGVGDRQQVWQLFKGLHLGSPEIYEGQFADTVTKYKGDKIALLHVDCAFYEPTKLCLQSLYEQVVEGGFIVVFGYGYWEGVKAAVDEFWKENNLKPIYLTLDRLSIYWRKTKA